MLTRDNAYWILLILASLTAAWGVVWCLGRNTYWELPARDLADVDPAEAQHWDPAARRAPVVWSDAVAPGGWVCAAPAADMPKEICGWPAGGDGCPEHGALIIPDAAYEPADATHHDHRGGAR